MFYIENSSPFYYPVMLLWTCDVAGTKQLYENTTLAYMYVHILRPQFE